MTQKSICVIYFPHRSYMGDMELNPFRLSAQLNGWDDSKQENGMEQYLWFCFFKDEIDAPEFKVFYPKDFDDIKFEELKSLILQQVNTDAAQQTI